jgi:integrase
MLGHATITQTMDTYSHVMPGMNDIAATALEEALG